MLSRYFVYFIIYSFFGWIYETIYCTVHEKTWQNRGFLYGPCIPLYGVGATVAQIIFIDLPFQELRNASYILIFLVCSIGSFILEYGTSYVLERRFNARWWDYSGYFININGRICLEGLLVFGLGGIAAVYFIAPALDNMINKINKKVLVLISVILLSVFTLDKIYSSKYPNIGEGITTYQIVNKIMI